MLPHLQNSEAGRNKYEPHHNCIFQIEMTIPAAISGDFGSDVVILQQQVLNIKGLDTLGKGPELVTQKFMGTDRSYLAPKLDGTHAEIEIEFALNLRGENRIDDYTMKLLRAWNNLGYNMSNGETALKKDYCSEWFRVSVANRAGDIFHQVLFKDIMLFGGVTGLDDLDYTNNEPKNATAKFASDWWDETWA